MPRKMTLNDYLDKLELRNQKYPNNPIHLYPLDQEYVNNRNRMKFRCDNVHHWEAICGNVLTQEIGCKKCKLEIDAKNKSKSVDKAIEDFIFVHGDRYDYSKVPDRYKNNRSKVEILCHKHGSFFQTARDHYSGQGCPKCGIEKNTKTQEKFILQGKELHSGKYSYNKVDYINTYTKVVITCPDHGDFKQMPYIHLQNHGCPQCGSVSVSYKQITWLKYLEEKEGIEIQHALNGGEFTIPGKKNLRVDGFCVDTNTVYEFHGDAFHGNLKRYKPSDKCHPFNNEIAKTLYDKTKKKENFIRRKGYNLVIIWESDFDKLGIPLISDFNYSNVVHTRHEIPVDDISSLKIKLVDEKFKGYKKKHRFECMLCGNEFETTLSQRKQSFKKYNSIGCPDCSRVSTYNYNTFMNGVRKSISAKIGIHCDYNKEKETIEFDDVAIHISSFSRHCERKVGNRYNLNKFKYFKGQGKRLIIFFEDEWKENRDLILDKISYISNKSELPKIYARKCEIGVISKNEKARFLNETHIQGDDYSCSYQYGAFHENELVSVMTFVKPRIFMKGKDTNEEGVYELSRFASRNDVNVIGIASKFVKHFQREYNPIRVLSFADRRWSIGNLYNLIGFQLDRVNTPDYFYIVDGERKHRWQYRRDVIKNTLPNFDPALTEYQNMIAAGYDRIWGVGTLKYVISTS